MEWQLAHPSDAKSDLPFDVPSYGVGPVVVACPVVGRARGRRRRWRPRRRRRRRWRPGWPSHPGDGGHIRRHDVGVGAGDEVRRHHREAGRALCGRGEVDLVADDLPDRALGEALLARRPESGIEVGPTFPVVPASASVWRNRICSRTAPCRRQRCAVSTPPVPQPAAASTAPSIAAAAAARLRGSFFGVKPLEGLRACRIDLENAVQTGDLEDLRDVAVAADDRSCAALRPQPLDSADQDAERGRVDEGRVVKSTTCAGAVRDQSSICDFSSGAVYRSTSPPQGDYRSVVLTCSVAMPRFDGLLELMARSRSAGGGCDWEAFWMGLICR